MSDWYSFDEGRSVGLNGSEGGTILCDEEHPYGARITLEAGTYHSFSITCGVYGWMVHTRYFSDESAVRTAFDEMKIALVEILDLIPLAKEMNSDNIEAISTKLHNFVETFP